MCRAGSGNSKFAENYLVRAIERGKVSFGNNVITKL